MQSSRSNAFIAAAIVFAIFLWGGNNAGTKFLVAPDAGFLAEHPNAVWPAIWTGGTRFLCAGFLLLCLLHQTRWFGVTHPITPDVKRQLWWRGGLSLAAYIIAFNLALSLIPVSHVALYLGAAPVWALLWEGRPPDFRLAVQRYGAALLALSGVFTLVWPSFRASSVNLLGEVFGISCSVLWTLYGRQCRFLTRGLSGIEVSAHTMWRAGALLLPLGVVEVFNRGFHPVPMQFGIQAYCIVAGGVIAFGIWNVALRQWPTSKVYLFNNLIPLSSTSWAHFTLGEAVSATFWIAMALVVAGVIIGQANLFAPEPPE